MLRRRPWVLAVLVVVSRLYAATVVDVRPDHSDAIYKAGETASWTVSVKTDGQNATGTLAWKLLRGGLTAAGAGTVDLADGQAKVEGSLAESGTLLMAATFKGTTGLGGAVFDPDGIKPSMPVPDDFDAFWDGKLAELAKIPMNVQIEPVDVGDPNIEYAKITMDGYGGSKIHGQIAKPKGKTHLPAIFTVQWAGVYPLDRNWVLGDARAGRLCLDIEAHDMLIDQPKAYYDNLNRTTLAGYPGIGKTDREKSYFLRMFLSCYRGADWLATNPDWDGKHLIVTGGSQGGGQSLVAAGLHPAITALSAMVPALCDHSGQLVGRAPGWPQLCGWGLKPSSDAVLQASRYFDAVNFVHRIKAHDAIVGCGAIDQTCPPAGCIAAYNLLTCAKQLVIMPLSGHGGPHQEGYYAAREAWLRKVLAN